MLVSLNSYYYPCSSNVHKNIHFSIYYFPPFLCRVDGQGPPFKVQDHFAQQEIKNYLRSLNTTLSRNACLIRTFWLARSLAN